LRREKAEPVLAERDHLEFFVPETPDRQEGHDHKRGQGVEHHPETREEDQHPAQDRSQGRAQVQPEAQHPEFPVEVIFTLILVIEVVCGNIKDAVGRAENGDEQGRQDEILGQAEAEEDQAVDQESAPDDLGDGQPVVDPARGKGDEKRHQGVERNDRPDLPAVEADLEEMEGDEEEDGVDRHLPAEVDEMNFVSQVHGPRLIRAVTGKGLL